jgi:CBS domain-containing protein
MQVHRVASKHVETAHPQDRIERIAERMKWEDIGFMPVVDETERAMGVVTDRDITVRVVGEARNPKDLRARDVMSQPVHWVFGDAELEDACRLMMEKGVRRLLVCDHQHRPTGVLSLDDLAVYSHGDTTVGRVLEHIVQPVPEIGYAD